jgi:biotin carboxyl carrier protein
MSVPRSGRTPAAAQQGAGRDFETLAEEILPALVARLRASGLAEIEVRRQGWRVRLRRDLHSPRRQARVVAGEVEPDEPLEDVATGQARSPAVGYFSPSPALRVGRSVQAGDTLGGVDVLGISVEVTAPTSGLVSGVLVEKGQAVEYGQVLAEIEALAEPAEDGTEPGR